MTPQRVEFQSAEYFRLLDAHPTWARYFALGANVIVVLDGRAYEVYDSGSTPQLPAGNPFLQVTPAVGQPLPGGSSIGNPATSVAPQPGTSMTSAAPTEPGLPLLATVLGCLGLLLAAGGLVTVFRLRRG